MESIKPSFYSVGGEELPKRYNGISQLKQKRNIENENRELIKGIKNDDLLIVGIMLLILDEKNDDNYIILLFLAFILSN